MTKKMYNSPIVELDTLYKGTMLMAGSPGLGLSIGGEQNGTPGDPIMGAPYKPIN